MSLQTNEICSLSIVALALLLRVSVCFVLWSGSRQSFAKSRVPFWEFILLVMVIIKNSLKSYKIFILHMKYWFISLNVMILTLLLILFCFFLKCHVSSGPSRSWFSTLLFVNICELPLLLGEYSGVISCFFFQEFKVVLLMNWLPLRANQSLLSCY